MITGFGNNIASALASDITANQTSITLVPGAGESFAKLLTTDISNPSSPHKIYAKLTLTDSQQTVFEICHLISVSNDTLTVIRGQEGTVAKGWALNDVIANFATRGSEQSFVQIEQLQGGDFTSATAGGTPNALAISLPSTFSNNNTNDWLLKTPLLVTPIATNSGAATLQLTMGGRVLGTYPLVKGSNTVLRAGDIVAKTPFLTVFNAEQERFIVLNPTTDVGSVRTVNTISPDAGGNVALPMYGLGLGPVAKSDAYSNIAQFYRVNVSSANAPPITGNIAAGVVSLPCDAAPSTGYVAVSGNGAAYVGSSNTPANGVKWSRIYTTDYKPTAGDVNAYTKKESDDRFIYKTGDTIDWLTVKDGLSTGNDITVGRTLFVKGMEFIVKQGLQDPVNNYRQTNGMRIQGAGNLFVDVYQAERMGEYHFLGIHVANGGADGWYEFRNDGSFSAGSTVGAGGNNGSKLYSDGNLSGSMWGGYLSNWLNQNISNAQNNAQNWAYQNLVNAVRLSGRTVIRDSGGRIDLPSGCVYTGMSGANYNPDIWGAYSAIQVLINGQWATVGTV